MKTIQKYLYYLLLTVTPLIMFSNTSELFEFNKIITIYIISFLILCVWIVRMLEEQRILFRRTPFDLFIALFFLSQIASTAFSIDIHTSIFGYYGRFNGGLLSLFSYLVIFYSLVEFFHSYHDKKTFLVGLLKVSLFTSTLVILWGVPGKMGHDLSCFIFSGKFDNACWTDQFDPAARMFSTLGQPNWLGAYLSITFFISLYFFFTSSRKNGQPFFYLYAFLSVLQIISIFFTNSRSSIFAVIPATILPLMWLFVFRKSYPVSDLKLKTAVILLSFAASVLFFKTGVQKIDKYLTLQTYFGPSSTQAPLPKKNQDAPALSPDKVTASIDIRKIVWEGALELGRQYPLFGTGVETFAYSYYFVRPAAHNLTSEWDYLYNKAHNEYLNFFATTGYFGIISYLLFIIVVLVIGLKWSFTFMEANHEEGWLRFIQILLLASWITVLITNFFGFSTTVTSLYFYLIPALLTGLEYLKKHLDTGQEIRMEHNRKMSGSSAWLTYGIPLILGLFFVQYFVSYWLADTKYALAENLAKINDYQNSVALLNDAMRLRPDHVYEDKLSFYLANLAFIASYQKDTKLADQLMRASAAYNESSLRKSPQNILYWKTKIKDLYVYYQITLDTKYILQGIDALKKAEQISPTDAKLPYFLATYYSMMYDEYKDPKIKKEMQEKSFQSVEKSIKLKPDYFESYFLKAQLYKKFKMIPQARETYEFILKNITPGNKQVEEELSKL